MSRKLMAEDGGGRFALTSAIRSSSSVGWFASTGIVAGSTGPIRASTGRCCKVFGGWTGTKAFLKNIHYASIAKCWRGRVYIRRILSRILQDDRGSSWVPREHGGRVIDLAVNDDPAAIPCIVLLYLFVWYVLGRGLAGYRGGLAAGCIQVDGFGERVAGLRRSLNCLNLEAGNRLTYAPMTTPVVIRPASHGRAAVGGCWRGTRDEIPRTVPRRTFLETDLNACIAYILSPSVCRRCSVEGNKTSGGQNRGSYKRGGVVPPSASASL